MTQFIGYHLCDCGCGKAMPIAVGTDKQTVLACVITRCLTACVVSGAITVQERDDIAPSDFAELAAVLAKVFSEPAAQHETKH